MKVNFNALNLAALLLFVVAVSWKFGPAMLVTLSYWLWTRNRHRLSVIPEVVFGDPGKCLPIRRMLDFRQKHHGNDELWVGCGYIRKEENVIKQDF